MRDLLLTGVAGGLAAGLLAGWWLADSGAGEAIGSSFLLACVWLALNFVLLAQLLGALQPGPGGRGLFLFWMACAKLPAAYIILWWLYQASFLDHRGLTAGLCSFPIVLLVRGLLLNRPEAGR